MTVTKRDLAIAVAKKLNATQEDMLLVIQTALESITEELAAGHSLEFRNFGVFEIMKRSRRIGRNPNRPEKTVAIPERVIVKFKPGKEMRQRVQKLDPDKLA